MKSLGGIRRRHPADSKAPGQADNCETQEQRPRIDFAPVKSLGEKRAAHASDDDGKESPELEHPIAPRKLFRWQQLWQQTILRGSKERSLCTDQENRRQRQFQVGSRKRSCREEHHANFKHLRPNSDAAFAESVRQVSAQERKENERRREERADKEFKLIAMRFVFFDRKNQVDNKKFQSILIEGALKLRGDQAPEPQPPLFLWRRYGEFFVGRHARSPKRCD